MESEHIYDNSYNDSGDERGKMKYDQNGMAANIAKGLNLSLTETEQARPILGVMGIDRAGF